MHGNQHDEPWPVPQPRLSAQCFQNAVNFLRIESAGQKVGAIVCALFVVNRFSLKSITIGKRGNILSCVGGKTFKPLVAHDAGITRGFDENVFKTKFEAERSISFIFAGYDRPRRVDIVKALRLRDRGIDPNHGENR
jgi:hypothetical protein